MAAFEQRSISLRFGLCPAALQAWIVANDEEGSCVEIAEWSGGFHIGATVHRAKRAYERAVKTLAAFDKKHPGLLADAERKQRQEHVAARDQAQRHWQGAQRFQHMLMRALWSPTLTVATARPDQLIRVAAKVENPYIQIMGAFLANTEPDCWSFTSVWRVVSTC
jgi:DNA segregation ATPase FtsK/SpoIIIE-like protein